MPDQTNSSNNVFNSALIKPAEAEDYRSVIKHILAGSLAGRAQLWPRSQLVQPHEPSYFKPDKALYRDTLKHDRRNGKELEYIHSCGTWIEQALCALDLFKSANNEDEQGRLLSIVEECLEGSKEILAMRTTHFHTVLTKGKGVARQLADLVETKVVAKHAQVHSDVYAEVYKELSAKYVIEAAKNIAKKELANPSGGDASKSK